MYLRKAFNIPEKYAYPIAILGFWLLLLGYRVNDIFLVVAYPFSSYGMIIMIVALTKTIPRIIKYVTHSALWKYFEEIPVLGLVITDMTVRTRFFLYIGTLINIFYVALKITAGILYHSLWLSFMGGYYLALAILRLFIIHFERKYDENSNLELEFRRYKSCGIVLFVLDAILAYIVWLAAQFKAIIDYPGFLIYGMALYSFYSIIHAVYILIKNRKRERPMYGAARIASFTAALVSMLSLEIAMMARFGAEDIKLRHNMTIWAGSIIFVIVTYMAITMIYKGIRMAEYFRSRQ